MAWRINSKKDVAMLPKAIREQLGFIDEPIKEKVKESKNGKVYSIYNGEFERKVDEIFLEYYDAKRKGTTLIDEKELKSEIERLRKDYYASIQRS